jgi:hypothetical protein
LNLSFLAGTLFLDVKIRQSGVQSVFPTLLADPKLYKMYCSHIFLRQEKGTPSAHTICPSKN